MRVQIAAIHPHDYLVFLKIVLILVTQMGMKLHRLH